MTVRVGVTGHRHLADERTVQRLCIEAIRDLDADVESIEILSSLAEGADRLVAELVPDHAARLVAILPLEPDDYRDDFATAPSRQRFDTLLAGASSVEITGPDVEGTRESAYERAGLAIVDQCEVLLALWDGEPSRGRGGTAQIVEAARDRGRVVIHIPVERRASQ
jgi:hypothetical protein